MKILLISVNQERFPHPVFPIGAYIIAKSIMMKHEVDFVDLNLLTTEEALQRIREVQPDIIGISMRNLDNVVYLNYKSFIPELKVLVSQIRKDGYQGKIILGGAGFSIMPKEILDITEADYGIIGPGEKSFQKLLEKLQNHEDPPQLIINDAEDLYENPFTISQQLIELNAKFNFEWYKQFHGSIGITTKRGCNYNCIYCTYPIIEGRTCHLRKPEDVVNEMEFYLKTMGINYFLFTDSVFNDPVEHSRSIAQEIKRRELPVSWTGSFDLDNLTREDILLFKDTGCEGVDLGMDSGSNEVLKRYGKSCDTKAIYKATEECKLHDMPVYFNIILGGPGETEETLNETFSLLEKTEPESTGIVIGMRIYPKTPLYYLAIKEGVINIDTDLTEPHFYIAPEVKDCIVEIVKAESVKHPSWIIPGINY